MCDDTTNALLKAILDEQYSIQYEMGGYFTIGGGPGTYVLKSPWNTECEYQLALVTSTYSTPAGFTVSESNPVAAAPIVNTAFYGALATGGEGNPFTGIAAFVRESAPLNMFNWLPMGKGGYLYFTTAVGASNTMLATIGFRRLSQVYIPNTPRPKPHTHSQVASRRPLRMTESLSKQYSGYDQQYQKAGTAPYHHEEIPENQDTANVGNIARRLARRRG